MSKVIEEIRNPPEGGAITITEGGRQAILYWKRLAEKAADELESKNKDIEQINNRINEISNKECASYPDIENADVFTSLWAIEQTLEGRILACDDLHKEIERYKAVVEAGKAIMKDGKTGNYFRLSEALSNLKEKDK